MKKMYSFVMVFAIAISVNAQLVFNENFSGFTEGNLGTQGLWIQSGTGTDVQISTTTPLTYTGYTSGSQYATVSSVDGTDPRKLFSATINTTTDVSIFMSFVVRVTSATASDAGATHSLALFNTADPDLPFRFYVSTEPGNASQVRFGILTGNSTNPANIAWTSIDSSFTINTTYLIVARYDISSAGGNNDDAWLWVNPGLTTEPATASAAVSLPDANEANFGDLLNALGIFQNSTSSPAAAYDGFRVAYGASSIIAWTNLAPAGAPLPVQLTSFEAEEAGMNTKLVWNTAEESGIVNYVIERSTDGRNFIPIGSVKAANLKTYSYTDAQPASKNNFYRLKMDHSDGSFKYSYIISVKSKLDTHILLSPNPVKNVLMIQHPKAGKDATIQIVSSTGQIVKDIRLSANAVITYVDLVGFTNGFYQVVFKNGSVMFGKTIIKQ
jgi:hypothetical protein